MKIFLFFMLTCLGTQLTAIGARSAGPHQMELEEKILSLFELDSSISFGTKECDEALLNTLAAKGKRDDIVSYVLSRAELVGINVTIHYNGLLFFSWKDADDERRIVDVEIQVTLDERRQPMNVVSSLKKGKPLPVPKTVPAFETPIEEPPRRTEKKQ